MEIFSCVYITDVVVVGGYRQELVFEGQSLHRNWSRTLTSKSKVSIMSKWPQCNEWDNCRRSISWLRSIFILFSSGHFMPFRFNAITTNRRGFWENFRVRIGFLRLLGLRAGFIKVMEYFAFTKHPWIKATLNSFKVESHEINY